MYLDQSLTCACAVQSPVSTVDGGIKPSRIQRTANDPQLNSFVSALQPTVGIHLESLYQRSSYAATTGLHQSWTPVA